MKVNRFKLMIAEFHDKIRNEQITSIEIDHTQFVIRSQKTYINSSYKNHTNNSNITVP